MNNPGVNVVALPAWLVGIVGAWMVSAEMGAAATLGYLSQWTLKAPAKVKDWLPPLAVVAAAFLLYVFWLGHKPEGWQFTREWFSGFALWAASALGIGSVSGHTGGAPKTNSL